MPASSAREILRFGEFELDVVAYTLTRSGHHVRLERRPMDLLILLVHRRGELVTRAEIVDSLWGKDVFVDVETGVHTAVRKIRQALGDAAETPVYLETVPGKGYRFIAPVEVEAPSRQRPAMAAAAAMLAMALAGAVAWGWFRSTSEPAQVRLAVLPFTNLTGDPTREYIADGLAEETIVALGQVDPEHLVVVGRTSSSIYRGTTKTLADIGRELGVEYLVESSLRSEGSEVRVISKLIRVRDQLQLWSASYDREPTRMLAMQRELSGAIAEQVRLRLSPERLEALSRRHTRNPDAYDLYLRGVTFSNQRTPATTARAIEYFRQATALDPDYALAWAGLSFAYAASPVNGDAPTLAVWPQARAAAEQAIRAGPGLAESQFSMAYVNWMFDWDWPAAERGLREAIARDPRSGMAHVVLGHLLSQTGRHGEAQAAVRRARELDPLFAMMHAMSSQVLFQARDFPEAIAHARRAIVLDPEFWIGHIMSAQAHEQLGDTTQALEEATNAARFSGSNSKSLSLRAYVFARTGQVEQARELLRTMEEASRTRFIPPYAIALVHAGLGDRDAAFAWLERAYSARDVHVIFLPVDAKWDAYRSDPRFRALLARCDFMRVAGRATP